MTNAATTKEALEPPDRSPTVDAMWEALKAACCKNPAEAKLAVFVSEKKFKEALAPFAAPMVAPVVDHEAKAKEIVEEYKQRVMQLPSGDAVPCAKWLETRLRIALDLAAPASTVAPVEQSDVTGSPILAFEAWLLRWVADNGRKLTQDEYGIAYAAFIAAHPGEGPKAHVMSQPAPASPAALRDEAEMSIEQAAKVVYRKYGANLASFWRDAFAAEAQKNGRTEVEQYGVDGNCIHCIPICHRCRLTTIEAHLKEKDEIRSASTPPSTLARKAAVDQIVKGWFWHLPERDQNRARMNIEQIIERCFAAESEK